LLASIYTDGSIYRKGDKKFFPKLHVTFLKYCLKNTRVKVYATNISTAFSLKKVKEAEIQMYSIT
jgi:hypothetical protein